MLGAGCDGPAGIEIEIESEAVHVSVGAGGVGDAGHGVKTSGRAVVHTTIAVVSRYSAGCKQWGWRLLPGGDGVSALCFSCHFCCLLHLRHLHPVTLM